MTGKVNVGAAVAKLQQAMESLGKAQTSTAVAEEKAGQVQNHAAQSGFRGVAERIGAVRESIKRTQGMQINVGSQLDKVVGATQEVDDDMTPQQVVSTLTPPAGTLGQQGGAMAEVTRELEKLKGDVAAALQGGQPGPLIAVLDQAKQASQETVGGISDSKGEVEKVIAQARETGNV